MFTRNFIDCTARGSVVNGRFLLDSDIPSSLTRLRPEPKVRDWVAGEDNSSLHIAVSDQFLSATFQVVRSPVQRRL